MNYMNDRELEIGPWELTVLALLREAPMHPYQMRRLIRTRHKDELLALKHGSLYHAIGRLERAGLIAVESTSREGRRPERTTYRVTPAGNETLRSALSKSIAVPRREPSEFMTAVSFLVHMEPADAAARLEERVHALEQAIAELEAGMTDAAKHVERIHLIESEYLLAMQRAELAWVEELLGELQRKKLAWSFAEIARQASDERELAGDQRKPRAGK
jgi:DNA-binding PadR family transcriptional regulator